MHQKIDVQINLSQFLITSLPKFPRSIVTSIGDIFSFLPISLFQHSHSTFVIIRFRPFRRLFINLTMCERALFPKPTTTLGLVEQAFWRVPFFTERVIASSSKVILAAIVTFYHWGFYLWDFGSSMVFAHSAAWKNSETDLMVELFPRLSISWRKLQLFPFKHCPLVSQCQQSPRILCTRCFVPWFLTTAFFSKFPILFPKFLFRRSCSILLFTIVFNLW